MDATALLPIVGSLVGAVVGGAISGVVSLRTVRATLQTQLALEEQRFSYQRELEQDKRDHEASGYRRLVRRAIRKIDNTSAVNPLTRIFVPSWDKRAEELEGLLSDAEARRSLDDEQYDAAWRVHDEARSAIFFLRSWDENKATHNVNMDVILGALGEYEKALEHVHAVFGDDQRAARAVERRNTQFKGCGFIMTDDFSQPALYPNP